MEVDRTGVPVRPSETEGRQSKSEDGKAGTREVKLARLFTVSALDGDGRVPLQNSSMSSDLQVCEIAHAAVQYSLIRAAEYLPVPHRSVERNGRRRVVVGWSLLAGLVSGVAAW